MAKESSIVGREASPACRIINSTPEPPVHAPASLYPGTGKAGVNTEPGNPKYAVKKDDTTFPDYVEPKGSTL